MRHVPTDPLARFLAIAQALVAEKRWWDDRSIVRYAALPLVMAPLVMADGDAAKLTRATIKAAEAMRTGAGWMSQLRGPVRYVLVAMLTAGSGDAAAFGRECEGLRDRFRTQGVRRGGAFEFVAAAMLHLGRATSARDVARMHRIYEAMKQQHWWLTGPEDLPAAAMLAVHGSEPSSLVPRIEAIFQRLQAGGLRATDGVQMASHVLYLAPGSDAEVSARFLELHRGFKDAGVSMWDNDRDELALLSLLDAPAGKLIAMVLDHRAKLRSAMGWIGPTTSFSYACGTAFLAARAGQPVDEVLERDLSIAHLLMATNAARVLRDAQQSSAAS